MTDRKQALIDLLGMVEAGEARPWQVEECAAYCVRSEPGEPLFVASRIGLAYEGSLDSAKALHESVLPLWDNPRISWPEDVDPFCEVQITLNGKDVLNFVVERGVNMNPARAWLIAILKALIEEDEQ